MRKTLLWMSLLTVACAARADTPSAASDILPPEAPTMLHIQKTFTTATLSWERIPRVTSYTVEYTVSRYFFWTSTQRVVNYQSNSYILRYPWSLSRYTFRVYAMAGPVSSPSSPTVSVISPLFGGTEFLKIIHLAA